MGLFSHSSSKSEPATKDAADEQTPLDIGVGGWKATVRRTQARIKRDRVTMVAGSLAYHWFLAMFPAIIAALGILTLVNLGSGTVQHMTHGIAKALPSGASGVFDGAVRAATRKASGSAVAIGVGVIVAVWSASSGMSVLQQALDVAYEVPTDRKFLARRLWSVPLLAAVAILGGAGMALTVFGQPIGSALRGVAPVGGVGFTVGWTVVRWVVTFLLLSVLFSAIYALAPNRGRPRWQWVTPGGLVATGVFLVASLGFSYYVSAFGSYGKTYGSFAGVAILIFWLWLIGVAVLVGAEINAETERQVASDAVGEPVPVTGGGAGRGDREEATRLAG